MRQAEPLWSTAGGAYRRGHLASPVLASWMEPAGARERAGVSFCCADALGESLKGRSARSQRKAAGCLGQGFYDTAFGEIK